MKRKFCILIITVLIMLSITCTAFGTINFNGSQSATYDLSNGKRVRIEYHGGQPHYHELEKKGSKYVDKGSENLSNNDIERVHNWIITGFKGVCEIFSVN